MSYGSSSVSPGRLFAVLMLLLCEFHAFLGLLLLGCRCHFTFTKLGEVLHELLEAATDKVDVLVTLLEKDLSNLGTFTLIVHVDNYKFVRRVFEAEKLGNKFVTADIWRRIIESFFDMAKHIILWLAHIQEQELCVLSNAKHLCSISHCRHLRDTSLVAHN